MIKISFRYFTAAAAAVIIAAGIPVFAQKVTISPGIPVIEADLRNSIKNLNPEKFAASEILIYGYTPPTEVYTLDSSEILQMRTEQGELRALIKVINEGKLDKAVFIIGKGDDVKSMISELGKNILLIFPQ